MRLALTQSAPPGLQQSIVSTNGDLETVCGFPGAITAAHNASAQSIPAGIFTVLTNWTTDADGSGGAWNPTTGLYTVREAGLYSICAQLQFQSTLPDGTFAALGIGAGVTSWNYSFVTGGVSNCTLLCVPRTVRLARSAVILFAVLQQDAIAHAINANTWLQIQQVGT